MSSRFVISGIIMLFLSGCSHVDQITEATTVPSHTISSNISHLCVRNFCQDSLGYVWMATARGLNRYNGYEFAQYFHDEEDTLSLDNDMIYSLFCDSHSRLWVGTTNGVNRYDFEHDRFIRYVSPDNRPVLSFHEDSDGSILAATTLGIDKVNEKTHTLEKIQDQNIISLTVGTLAEDNSGILWAGTDKGLAYRSGSAWHVKPLEGGRSVTCICQDPQGNFMLGTSAGIFFFDPLKNVFLEAPEVIADDDSIMEAYIHFIKEVSPLKYLIGTSSKGFFLYDALRQTLQENPPEFAGTRRMQEPLCCFIDSQQDVWIGSFDNGFSMFDTKRKFFNLDYDLFSTFKGVYSTRIIEDDQNNYWVGTRYDGLWYYGRDRTVRRYDSSNSNLFASSNLVEGIYIDSHEHLWLAGAESIAACSAGHDGSIRVLRIIPNVGTGSATITEDGTGNIWFGLATGLYMMEDGDVSGDLKEIYHGNIPKILQLSDGRLVFSSFGEGLFTVDPKTYAVSPIGMPSKEAQTIARRCVDIFEDSDNRIWLGSYNEGLMCMKGSEYFTLGMEDGLSCNDITCIEEDLMGDIWLSTANGISRIDRNKAITNYFENDGIGGNLFHEKAGLLSSDGRIFFTGNHGVTSFDPKNIVSGSHRPKVIIESLKINNEDVPIAEKGSVLKKAASYTNSISLNHKHHVIAIDYCGLDFPASKELTYSYMLEGLDKDWTNVGGYRRASYSNLRPGNYTFKIKAMNSDGLESISPAILHIHKNPAPWATVWAFISYAMLLSFAIFAVIDLLAKIRVQKERLAREASERQKEQETTKNKMMFFADISHELRTTLTLIYAPTQQLMRLVDMNSGEGSLLNTINRNCGQLHKLLNQLLDFRKIEDGMFSLKVAKNDIVKELDGIVGNYMLSAADKHVSIEYATMSQPYQIWFDSDKVDKILNNLLSNAMKFTPRDGMIEISFGERHLAEIAEKYGLASGADKYFEISISDNGPCIPEGKLRDIFNRYSQVQLSSSQDNDNNYVGSGIGLHYSKRLVEIHHGSITAENLFPRGVRFSFVLPCGDVYGPEEKAGEPNIDETNIREPSLDKVIVDYKDLKDRPKYTGKREYTIMVVEDNSELLAYFRQLLGEQYNVIGVSDGLRAWSILQTECPDLILSDVVMPGLSGYELCSRVKQHRDLCHIPVILLTAKTTMPEQIEGLTNGADAYVCKPFNVEYLLLLIGNQFRNRSILRRYYFNAKLNDSNEDLPVKLNEMDRKFMDKLMGILERSISDVNLNINDIAKEMAFSRTGFYRKIKGLTNVAPADFIREYRLGKAAKLIKEGSWSLYEVAEKVGFGDYSHFSVIFKKHFGVSPREYKNRREN